MIYDQDNEQEEWGELVWGADEQEASTRDIALWYALVLGGCALLTLVTLAGW